MANTLLTPVQITREGLRVLHNNLVFLKGVNRQYSDEFAQRGAKIGSTVNVRKPNKYFVRKGPVMQTQGTTETYVPLTLNTQWGTDVSFSSTELTLSLDDFSKRILTPAMARIAAQMDQDALQGFITGSYTGPVVNGTTTTATIGGSPVWNIVGTPGTTPGTGGGSATGLLQYNAPICYLNAGMMLDNNAAPRDMNRRVVMNPAAHAQSVAGLSGLYNDGEIVSEQYRKGVLGNALGFEFAMDQNIYTLTRGTASASIAINTTNAGTGESTIITKTGTGTLVAGDVYTVANVYSVNPENQMSTGQLQQFVVTSAITLSGTADSISVAPAIVLAGTGIATGTVNRVPTANDVVTVVGAASTATPQNLAYHQDAFTMATADLELPSGVDFAARETYDGVSMRIVRAFDITNDQFPCRIDVLGGFAALRPELACRIAG